MRGERVIRIKLKGLTLLASKNSLTANVSLGNILQNYLEDFVQELVVVHISLRLRMSSVRYPGNLRTKRQSAYLNIGIFI